MFNRFPSYYNRHTHPQRGYAFGSGARRSAQPQPQQQVQTWSAEQVFAAAVTAQEINGEYLKIEVRDDQGQVVSQPNKVLMRQLLTSNTEFTDSQLAQGQQVREHYQKLLFEQISGELKDFLSSALRIASKPQFQSNEWLDLAIAAALPSCADRDLRCQAAEAEREQLTAQSEPVGQVGDRVTLQMQVVQARWSQKWNCWTINARAGSNLFFFFHKQELTGTVQVRGTVKGHRDRVTQLNRVKVSN